MTKIKELEFKCRCVAGNGCGTMVVQDFGDKEIMVDIWRNKKPYGVVLNEADVKKLITFLEKI